MSVVVEYSSGLSATSGLRGICVGPDGNLWACAFSTNKIVKITPAGVITEYAIPTGTGPYRICSDGTRLWATCNANNYLISITTSGTVTEYNLGASKGPRSLVVGPDGNLWVAFQTASTIAKVVTSGGSVSSVTEYATTTGSAGPFGLCSDGTNLWATLNTVSKIAKITTAGVVTEYATTTGSAGPFDCCYGPDGNVWFTEQASGINKIAKITSGGTVTEYSSVSADPQGICAHGGELWVVLSSANKIGRYDTSGAQLAEYAIPTGSSSTRFITATATALWFGEASGNKIATLLGGTPADTWAWADSPRPSQAPAAATDSWGWNDTPGVAPSATPTLGSLTVDAYGRVSGVVTGCGTATTIKVYRSTAGGTYADITSNCTITSLGGGSFSFTDKRASYGSQPVALNATGYWKVAGYITAAGPQSAAQTAVPAIDKATVELAVWASLHTEMATQATRENTSHLGYAYPGRFLLSAAYVAYQYPSKTSEALTDLDTWWTFVKTQINADNLFIANGYNTHVYTAHNAEMVVYLCACVRMLNRLTGNATAASLSSDMIAKANAIGKAMIDKLARTSLTAAGFGGGSNTTISGATAWSSGGLVSTGNIIKPSSGATRIYRVITPGLSFAALGSTEPTWPTTAGGIVQSGAAYLQECTNEFTAWQASHAYAVGDMVRPTSRNNRTYRCSTAGTSDGSEPTWGTSNGGTTTDGTVDWTETTRTGDIFDVAYDPTTPYAGPGAPSKIGDEMSRVAAAFSALMNSAATDFTTGGSKRTAANTIALDHAKLAGTLQVGTGALIQQYDWPTDDSLYASYTIHLLAVAIHEQGDSWLPELAASVDKTLAWLSTTLSTEPTVGNEAAGRPTTSTSSIRADIGWRDAAFRVRGTVNPITNTYWESCLHPGSTYNQAGQAASTEGNDLNYLSTLGVPAAFSIPQTTAPADTWGWADTPAATTTKARTAGDTWGWADTITGGPTRARTSADSWAWTDSPARTRSSARTAADSWAWADTAGGPRVTPATYPRTAADIWLWQDQVSRPVTPSPPEDPGYRLTFDIGPYL